MSTRVLRPEGRLYRHLTLVGFVALVAGCSHHASRFDNVFTNSTAPQQINSAPVSATPPQGLSRADLPVTVPQRLDARGSVDPNNTLFNARNVTRLNRGNRFGASQSPVQFGNVPQNRGQSTFARPAQRAPSIARQPLPPTQHVPSRTTLATPAEQRLDRATGGRLTLEEARALNDRQNAGTPLLARRSQTPAPEVDVAVTPTNQPSFDSAPSSSSFDVGTQWTRDYSPLPTQSPQPRGSISFPSNGSSPRAYTPPQGTYTADLDQLSTSSIRKAPKVIRSSVGHTPQRRVAQAPNIDRTHVNSVKVSGKRGVVKNGWSSAGGTYVTLRPGETIFSLSRRFGVPVDAIQSANGISDPTVVRSGQQILIPTYVYSPDAPVSAPDANQPKQVVRASTAARQKVAQPLPPKLKDAPLAEGFYVVQKGDTLSGIASRHQVSVAQLRDANGLQNSDVIRIGQRLKVASSQAKVVSVQSRPSSNTSVDSLPKLDQTTTASVVRAQAVSQKVISSTAVKPVSKPQATSGSVKRVDLANAPFQSVKRPRVKPVDVAKAQVKKVKPSAAGPKAQSAYTPPKIDKQTTASVKKPEETTGKVNFIWPVRGAIVSGFGDQVNGSRNDGINLDVPNRTPVRAAAAGEVIYASSGLADYGKLVLIRHNNGFVSAYAHNSELSVRRGQRVRQGQVVAKSGQSGSVKKPEVHFEIRKGKTPVNPLTYLPG